MADRSTGDVQACVAVEFEATFDRHCPAYSSPYLRSLSEAWARALATRVAIACRASRPIGCRLASAAAVVFFVEAKLK